MKKNSILYGALAASFALLVPIAAQAQDGSRVVMRRPLNVEAEQAPADPRTPVNPNACGGPANPCPDECLYFDPQWVLGAADPSACIGTQTPANATCRAFLSEDRSGALSVVPDSVCFESTANYVERCGPGGSPDGSGFIAGSRPVSVPGTNVCSVVGEVVVTGIGNPVVADGLLNSNGLWSIFGISSGVTPVCSFPTAAPATVECRVNGRASSPDNCRAEDYANLTSRNLVPISPGGTPPSDLRFASWVQPGFEVRGCASDWLAIDGAAPPACGVTTVPISVTCVESNAQSGNVPEEFLTCNPATRPADSRVEDNFQSCSFSLSPGPFSDFSNTCGPVTRTRSVTCTRSDGATIPLVNPECSGLVAGFIAGLPANQSVTSQNDQFLTVTESSDLGICINETGTQFSWITSEFGEPSTTCGEATQMRTVQCRDDINDIIVLNSLCETDVDAGPMPSAIQTSFQASGCSGPNFCSGGSILAVFDDASVIDRRDDCSTRGGTCLETGFELVNTLGSPATNYQSRCFGNGSVASTKPDGIGEFEIGGIDYTFGFDGWCDYSSTDGNRNCLVDAVAVAQEQSSCIVQGTTTEEINFERNAKDECIRSLNFEATNEFTITHIVRNRENEFERFDFCGNLDTNIAICSSSFDGIEGGNAFSAFAPAGSAICNAPLPICSPFPGSSSPPPPPPPPSGNASCMDECGESRRNNESWCTAGDSLGLIGREISRCVNGRIDFPSSSQIACGVDIRCQ